MNPLSMYDVINECPFLQNTDDVVEDFRKRIRHYEMLYETIDETDESDYSFIKVIHTTLDQEPRIVKYYIVKIQQW